MYEHGRGNEVNAGTAQGFRIFPQHCGEILLGASLLVLFEERELLVLLTAVNSCRKKWRKHSDAGAFLGVHGG